MAKNSVPGRLTAMTKTLLLLAALLLVFSVCRSDPAEAAGSYSVYQYTLDDNNYFQVYQNSSELNEAPTFISCPWDVYTSANYENGLRVTFYRSYNLRSNDQASALCTYLKNHSSAPYSHSAWYYTTSNRYGYTESVTIVYLLEGLNRYWDYYDFEYLWDWDPFYNGYGTTLSFEYYSDRDQWDNYGELWNNGCSAILNIYGPYGVKASFGMIFTEGSDQHVVRRCCVYETWD